MRTRSRRASTHTRPNSDDLAMRLRRGFLPEISSDREAANLRRMWARMIPVGSRFYAVARKAARNALLLEFLFVPKGRCEIHNVPPVAGVSAGFVYDKAHDAYRMTDVPHPVATFVRQLGVFLHGRDDAYPFEAGYYL